jgi:hypothetical protein
VDPGAPSAQAPAGRRAGVALGFAVAAALACWNVVAAPFGLVVGIGAVILAGRALRRSGPGRATALAALALAAAATIASGVVIGLTAGAVGSDLPGEPVVKGRTQAELDQVLSDAGARTRARRERAARELEPARGEGRDGGRP